MRWRTVIFVLLFGACLPMLLQGGASAEFRADMEDEYLEAQYDWGAFIDTRDVDHYLNYEGSLLRPLTRVRIYFRVFPRAQLSGRKKNRARLYEELWYHKGQLIGLRRCSELKSKKNRIGIVVVGKDAGGSKQAIELTNAVLRLLLDLQFQQMVADVVLVPLKSFDQIVGNLAAYKFACGLPPQQGMQMSIHFRCDPSGRDEYYYYAH